MAAFVGKADVQRCLRQALFRIMNAERPLSAPKLPFG